MNIEQGTPIFDIRSLVSWSS